MIVLLGASGYIGEAFAHELRQRGWPFLSLARSQLDYTRFELLRDCLRSVKPGLLINAAGHSGKPNVDACETEKAQTLLGNTLFPQMIAHACLETGTPWGHVSSGCIYNGARIVHNGAGRVEIDLNR